ncbi:MAG: hypothetical protein QOI06_2365 [Nocardioidaceae bacterium]|nr:hypothetical protein [Nocardioidaceae bacterium]
MAACCEFSTPGTRMEARWSTSMGPQGSWMEMAFANDLAAEHGVRVVSFDRPGYDGSSTAPFGLVSIARDAAAESQPPSGTCCPNTTGC